MPQTTNSMTLSYIIGKLTPDEMDFCHIAFLSQKSFLLPIKAVARDYVGGKISLAIYNDDDLWAIMKKKANGHVVYYYAKNKPEIITKRGYVWDV